MISSIRNPWIRRPLICLVGPFWSLAIIAISAMVGVEDSVRLLRSAWCGSRKYATGGVCTPPADIPFVGEVPVEQYITREMAEAMLKRNLDLTVHAVCMQMRNNPAAFNGR